MKREQANYEDSAQILEDKLRLNLKRNENELYECRGRIPGEYPIYIPPESVPAEKLEERLVRAFEEPDQDNIDYTLFSK